MNKKNNNREDDSLIWTENKKQEMLKTTVVTVNKVSSTAPNGTSGDYIVMDAKDWVVIIPVIESSFLMVKQWRHGERKLSIEFPGGVIENGEKPEAAAKRELKEETGFSAERIINLGTMNPNPALFSNHIHFFAALNLQDSGKQNLDNDEFVHFMKIEKEEVYKKMGSEEYCHALMASALCLFRQYESDKLIK